MTLFRPRWFWRTLAYLTLVAVLVSGGLFAWATFRYSQFIDSLTHGVGDTTFLASDGTEWFRLDEARHDVPLASISPDLQHAVLAVEDHRFFSHPGIDPIGFVRAAVQDLRSGGRVQGGSTITQQLARTLFLSNARTFGRKAREAAIAVLLESRLTKSQILELYLNRVYLSAGVYGVQALAENLFHKTAGDVTLDEAAMIAGLIRAPSALSPWANYDKALERSHLVLARMRDEGFITAAQEESARRQRPAIQPYRVARASPSGWAKDYARQQFREVFGGDHPPEWKVQTTFDRRLQASAEEAVTGGLARLGRPSLEAALVALDPRTGDVLAMVGGSDYARSTFNRAVRSRRQPGSAFKPMVYASALMHGYSPISMLKGLTHVTSTADPDWQPTNSGEAQPEEMTLRDALTESNNAAAASLQQAIGSAVVLKVASDAGLHHLPDVPSLALGTGEVSLLDLTAAYAMFPNGGQLPAPRPLVSVVDDRGGTVMSWEASVTPVISETVAYQMVTMLRDVVDRGTGRAARASGVRGPIAGKTGTTNDYHDAWFVGFSNDLVVGVWVGFDEPAPIDREAYASRIAVPIWADFMKRAATVRPAAEFPMPRGITRVSLCQVSHELPVDGCPVYDEYFKPEDTVPTAKCHIHQISFEDRAVQAIGGFLKELGGKLKDLFGAHR
ncbi:MAG: PBP1A family penicillin-binding protein [Acidobacteriaceae bacterium]|nr:PBP1A family penicillin-binding protein [Acidobacteriaceae bacterium]